MKKNLNLLIIGASGGVANALLQQMVKDRQQLNRLVLVDRDDRLLHNPFIPHGALDYEFVKRTIDVNQDRAAYLGLLQSHGIHVVIDLSINETRPMLEVTDAVGASYLNTGIANRRGESFAQVVLDIIRRKALPWHAPHILCAGMNPGIVNAWVRQGIERFGLPHSIVHFEYDTAQPRNGWLPIITWSRETFLDEIINDPAGYMDGRDKLRLLHPNALKNRVSMKGVLEPIMALKEYPRGFLLLHEENLTLAQRYDIPSRFMFAIDPWTMDYLEALYDTRGSVPVETMKLGDNREIALRGSVTVGVMLQYADRKVYFFNTTSHEDNQRGSGSCWQVGSGLHAALLSLLTDRLEKRIHFPEDLFGTSFERLAAQNLPVKEVVIDMDAGGN